MSEEKLVAVLDDEKRLVGYTRRTPEDGDVVVDENCDLPVDKTYKWQPDRKCFTPLGHGFGPVRSKPPISDAHLLYLLAKSHDDAPQEVRDWCRWYEENLKRRDEEAAFRNRRARR